MTHPQTPFSAPCIIDVGTVINKRDIHRLLSDLGRVRYIDLVDNQIRSEGEGYVMEVYVDRRCSTIIANAALYLNVYSFDCLSLNLYQTPGAERQAVFDLIQENRVLRLLPLSTPLTEPPPRLADSRAIREAILDFANQPTSDDEDWSPDFSN